MNKTIFYKFQNLPKEVKQILLMDEALEANEKMIEKFSLEEKRKEFFEIIRKVVLKEINIDQLLSALRERLGLEEEKARGLAIELAGLRFLPLQFWLGPVEDYIKKWGGDPKPYLDRLDRIFSPVNQLKDLLESILEKFGLTGFDQEKKKRLVNIIFSRVGELRNQEKTQNVLAQPFEQGGLGLDPEKAKGVAEEIERIVLDEELTKKDIERIRTKKERILKYEKKKERESAEWTEKSIPPREEELKKQRSYEVTKPHTFSQKYGAKQRNHEESVIESPALLTQGGKVQDKSFKMHLPEAEIKKEEKSAPKLIGPIEELRELKLEDWRRLAEDPKERIKKIKEKIDLLGKESIEKKAQAIKAWKENEINQLYLEIGRESMEQSKSVAEVIAERSQTGRKSLSMEEFELIADLNSSLRF